MSITAKELAAKLQLSPAAVSMALNGKPGVSAAKKKEILAAAEKYGYDFTRVRSKRKTMGTVRFVVFKRHGAIVTDTPFFAELTGGIEDCCKEEGFRLRTQYIYADDDPEDQIENLHYSDCIGLLLLGTEMRREDLTPFTELPFPVVLIDIAFPDAGCDCVLIDNISGAYLAATHLIARIHTQPGYLHSSYSIRNFEERADGFYRAVREAGMSASKSPVHLLAPSIEGAYEDMSTLLSEGVRPARGYFADNDLIAVGAMRALLEAGYRIPEDVSIVGFDNLPIGNYIQPALTTVHVPKQYIGKTAVRRLKERLMDSHFVPVHILAGVRLVERSS